MFSKTWNHGKKSNYLIFVKTYLQLSCIQGLFNMAELGDFLLGATDPLVDKIQVDVSMLDYDFVLKCDKINELKAVLKVLKVSTFEPSYYEITVEGGVDAGRGGTLLYH